MTRLHSNYLDLDGISLEEMEALGSEVIWWQEGVQWWIGDLARKAKSMGENCFLQVFPAGVSPGLIARCEKVATAYPPQDRNLLANWTIHMREANRPDRVARVQAHVDAGRTSDEAREANQQERAKSRWLLAVDVNYFLHRYWHSGAGVEAASGVAGWIERTVERLKEKGLTDCVCCFDAPNNHRKQLTEGWDDKYKGRPPKPQELTQQLQTVRQLIEAKNFACVSIEGMEADDVMASYAKQFDGKVTLLTQDKDCRQCLSDKCNILLDVEWHDDETSGESLPEYKWVTAKTHAESTGIRPEQWCDYQCIMGDNVDGIKGAVGIGQKGATDLITWFGSVEAAIQAAKDNDSRIKPAKRQALIEFEGKLETTRKLVTLRDDLHVTNGTRI